MIAVIASFTVPAEHAAAFEAAATDLAAKTRANEPGAKLYHLVRDVKDPTAYRMMELWEDEAAIEAHRETQWYKAAGPALGPLIAGQPSLERLEVVG